VEIVDKARRTTALELAAGGHHTARIYRIGNALGLGWGWSERPGWH